MSKVITFSRVFPKYHPKAGQPTYFVEQLQNSLVEIGNDLFDPYFNYTMDYLNSLTTKHVGCKRHTIRNGNRWKVGDKFSPRVWSGKPYASPQIIIAPDIEIKQIWDFEIKNEFDKDGWYNFFYLNGTPLFWNDIDKIAQNDGLNLEDMVNWFKANDGYFSGKEYKCSFKGQIICWNENVKY